MYVDSINVLDCCLSHVLYDLQISSECCIASIPSRVVEYSTRSTAGFIRVREMSGKFKFFQGQGIVREFYAVSVKNEILLKCQENVREFYKL